MASTPIYARSAATGAGTGASWTDAITTYGGAIGAVSAGGQVFLSEDHNEVQSTGNLAVTSPATTQETAIQILTANHAGAVPPGAADLTTGSVVTTSGSYSIIHNGFGYDYGTTFNVGSGSTAGIPFAVGSAATAAGWIFEAGMINMAATGGGSQVTLGSTSTANCRLRLINEKLKFSNVGQCVAINAGDFTWERTPATDAVQGTLPTNLLVLGTKANSALIEAVNLSALTYGAGKTLVYNNSAAKAVVRDSKLAPGWSTAQNAAVCSVPGGRVNLIRCSDTAGNYVDQTYGYEGSHIDELSCTLQGGATDNTTAKSRKIVTTSKATELAPFECSPIVFFNETTGAAIAVALEGLYVGSTVPNVNDIWLEVEYLTDSGDPLGLVASSNTKANILAVPGALPAGTGTWNNQASGTVKFRMSVSFTPAQKGFVTLRTKVAKAGTFYVDPKPIIAGQTVSRCYTSQSGALIAETAATIQVPQLIPALPNFF